MPLPAGCVRIDSALGEVPPDIFGGVLVVDRYICPGQRGAPGSCSTRPPGRIGSR